MVKASKDFNHGTMTSAGVRSFIVAALRKQSMYWKPIAECRRQARVGRGKYKCASCGTIGPASIKGAYKNGKPRKINNAVVDHILPVVDPNVGFVGYDDYIKRMFCELEGLQCLCHRCHTEKTERERQIATERKSYGNINE